MLLRLSSISEFAHLPVVTGEYYVDISRGSRNERLRKENPEAYLDVLRFIRESQSLPKTSELARSTAYFLENMARDTRSVQILEEALHLNPFNYGALVKLAELLDDLGRQQELVRYLEGFLRERTGRFLAWWRYAGELIKMRNYHKALRALEMALVTRTNDAQAREIYRLMSICYSEIGIRTTAVMCLKKSTDSILGLASASSEFDSGLPPLEEGKILDDVFGGGRGIGGSLVGTLLKGFNYYYLYSRRWGHKAAMKKIVNFILSRK